MLEELTQRDTTHAHIVELVSTALRQDKLSGISEMLRTVAEAINAYGAILWQVTPGSDLDASPLKGSLFVLAQWLQDDYRFALHDLPLESATGEAILNQVSVNVADVWTDPRVFTRTSFLRETGVKPMCSVPLRFLDGGMGALNLYRKTATPFTETEVSDVEQLASLIPALYQTVRDNVSLTLLRGVNDILNEAEIRSADQPLSKVEMKKVFDSIVRRLAATFQCVEASVFLEDRLEGTKRYELMATTWPGRFKKNIYSANVREGLTGWVLSRAKPVKIFDLAHFEQDKKLIQRDYPNLIWRDSLDIKETVGGFLQITRATELPPLSFMAVPVMMGDKVIGAIRCCTARQGPYYFADRELNLLKPVASQIASYTSNWMSRREMQQENESWRSLVQSVSRLNTFVHNELTRSAPDELRIFDEAMRVTKSVIDGAEIMDVRLLDEGTKELYFARTYGQAWKLGDESEINDRQPKRFSIRGRPTSAGAKAFQSGQVYIIKDVYKDPYYSETFPATRRMIIAPISVEDEIFGVLDIRRTSAFAFPKHAEAIAELLGHQLGLYHFLARNIGRLRNAEIRLKANITELERMRDQQAQTFEDLEHQLRSPIIQAYARVQSLLIEPVTIENLRQNLKALSGLCGKAKRVASSAGLFANLARQEPIETRKTRLQHDNLMKMLSETAADHELLTDPARGITFYIHRRSYELLEMTRVEVDHDLLEQAISNLLDNAGKYSSKRTRVEISWGMTGGERFQIVVTNKGLVIHSSDVRRCRDRGWRGSIAAAVTGEGSGIGLWIVDNIMTAHNGELIIVPTTAEGSTEVKLVFPASRGR